MRAHLLTIHSDPLVLIFVAAIYGIGAAIVAYSARIEQAKDVGYLSARTAYLPTWTKALPILLWLVWIVILILNWWCALALLAVRYALNGLLILERIGRFILEPLLDQETVNAILIATEKSEEIEAMHKERINQLKALKRNVHK